ncbi:hypothetical protein NNF59_002407 [Providencia stuartii]|nr:hypothetical protein [Providencia stuartii]
MKIKHILIASLFTPALSFASLPQYQLLDMLMDPTSVSGQYFGNGGNGR